MLPASPCLQARWRPCSTVVPAICWPSPPATLPARATSPATSPCLHTQVESLRYDRAGNLLATYNGGVSFWNFANRGDDEKQELPLPAPGAVLCGDVSPSELVGVCWICGWAGLGCDMACWVASCLRLAACVRLIKDPRCMLPY